MKAAVFLVALLACTAGINGRRLLAEEVGAGCDDVSSLSGLGVGKIGKIIAGFGLLPAGVPADVTVFLPSDAAVDAFLASVSTLLPGLNADNVVELATATGDVVVNKLVSALLYHIAPIGAAQPDDLLADGGVVKTLLSGYDLIYNADGSLTDGTTVPATTSDPYNVCNSAVYVVDKVLQPTESIFETPDTTLAEALALLSPGAATPSPAPAELPSL